MQRQTVVTYGLKLVLTTCSCETFVSRLMVRV